MACDLMSDSKDYEERQRVGKVIVQPPTRIDAHKILH